MDKKIIKLGLFLMLVAGLAALLLSNLNALTQPIIAQNQAREAQLRMQEVYPDADSFEQDATFDTGDIQEIRLAMRDGTAVGAVYTVSLYGYDGKITFLVGFELESQEVTGVRILSHTETPGLGANITQMSFLERFEGAPADRSLELVKTPPSEDYEIQAVTAATVSSAAVTNGVNTAREHFIGNY